MKYVLMYVDTARPARAPSRPSGSRRCTRQIYALVRRARRRVHRQRRRAPAALATATTIRSGGDGAEPVVVDGPYSEAKERIGGFSVIDVPDLDAAIAHGASTGRRCSCPGSAVEIRPVVDDVARRWSGRQRARDARRPRARRALRTCGRRGSARVVRREAAAGRGAPAPSAPATSTSPRRRCRRRWSTALRTWPSRRGARRTARRWLTAHRAATGDRPAAARGTRSTDGSPTTRRRRGSPRPPAIPGGTARRTSGLPMLFGCCHPALPASRRGSR